MAAESRPVISEALLSQVVDTARAQNREPSDLLQEAWTRYVEDQSWAKILAEGRENSTRLGLKDSDTERLIAEYRQENRGR